MSLGETSVETLENFSPPPDKEALQKHGEDVIKLTRENAELRRHMKRRTKALDTVRRAYIVDVERLKRSLRDQVEGQSATEAEDPDVNILGGIPSLDFRPVLELFAPTGDKLQMSPCEECGGTMEIVHYDEKEIIKLKHQIDILRAELAESGQKLGYSNAVAETYRLKTESASSEFEELNNTLLREIKLLKGKLVDAGPEVVSKILEERDKAESRLRSTTRTITELKTLVAELQGLQGRVTESDIKVAEMEYHLREGSKEAKIIASERDMHASTADELRGTVASLEEDLRHAADRNASLENALRNNEENNRDYVAKLRKLLDESKTNEAALRDELTALREEHLHNMLASEYDDVDSRSDQRSRQEACASGCTERSSPESTLRRPRESLCSPVVVLPPPHEEDDRMVICELSEGLRRKEEEVEYLREKLKKQDQDRARLIDEDLMARELEAAREQAGAARSTVERTAAAGEDILSGAYARREEQAALDVAQLRANLSAAEAQANKAGRENKKLLRMWNHTRARLAEVEGAKWGGEVDGVHSTESRVTAPSKTALSQHTEESAKGCPWTSTGPNTPCTSLAGLAASHGKATLDRNADSSTPSSPSEKNDARDSSRAADTSNDDNIDDVMTVAMTYLQEDCRRLQKETAELQQICNDLKEQAQTLRESLESVKSRLEDEIIGKQEAEHELEIRRELLSKATSAAAEHSMALHDAQEGMVKAKEELEMEKKDVRNLRLELKELGAVKDLLRAGLVAAKSSLELMTIAKSEAEALADQNALHAKRNAVEAINNAAWAEAEGMRAEETASKRLLSDLAAAENIAALAVELERCEHELKRRRREAKEHGEQMKEMRQVVAERTKLEEQVQAQHQTILDIGEKSTRDEAIIEEFKLEVVLLDGMRQEVLRLEAKTDQLQTQLVVSTSALEVAKNERKVTEVAGMEHSNRVDNARMEQLLLESTCKQRAAQILNMEEALRKLEFARAALQDERNDMLLAKEELSQMLLKQDEALLDNNKELRKFAVLKVDHLTEVRQHAKATKRLQAAEGDIKGLKIRLQRAIGAASMAENTANEAEIVRAAAVEEREAAAVEARTAKRAMERVNEQKERLRKNVHDLLAADATRLATNRAIATEVPYGEFTDEAGTMTTFLCPELTIRQLRRLPACRGTAPESTGRVVPALKNLEACDHTHKRACAHPALNHTLHDGRLWKRGPGAPPSLPSNRSLCGIPPAQAGFLTDPLHRQQWAILSNLDEHRPAWSESGGESGSWILDGR
ncbi:unnamed protein product [Scytosiphon promiscuus]